MGSKRRKELMEILLHDYEAATKHYVWAVAEMQRSSFFSSGEQYRKTRQVAETAYEDCERLRKAASEIGLDNSVSALTDAHTTQAPKPFKTGKDVKAPTKHWQIASQRTGKNSR